MPRAERPIIISYFIRLMATRNQAKKNHLGWGWNPVNSGINCQPQLVLAEFSSINSITCFSTNISSTWVPDLVKVNLKNAFLNHWLGISSLFSGSVLIIQVSAMILCKSVKRLWWNYSNQTNMLMQQHMVWDSEVSHETPTPWTHRGFPKCLRNHGGLEGKCVATKSRDIIHGILLYRCTSLVLPGPKHRFKIKQDEEMLWIS